MQDFMNFVAWLSHAFAFYAPVTMDTKYSQDKVCRKGKFTSHTTGVVGKIRQAFGHISPSSGLK